MQTVRIGIIQFPGSNCERETMLAVKRAGMEPVAFLWNAPREALQTMDGYILVGGFSYEDRSRAGVIAALDPVMQEIKLQSEKGKPILGICNGAQILVETGLVPGLENNKIGMALTENKRILAGKIQGSGYYNAWIKMRLPDIYQRNAFTRFLNPSEILSVPIAHGEGRFVIPPALLDEIELQGLAVFKYCDDEGKIIDEFPINPNGSIHNIAAISNKAGNVMAMMPHPERTPNGDAIFQSMREHILANHTVPVLPLSYYPRRKVLSTYQTHPSHRECLVELMITDNHAMTVQQTLRQLGFSVTIKRYVHWEIDVPSTTTWEKIQSTEVLFNPRKEIEVAKQAILHPQADCILVRAKEDLHGLAIKQTLRDHFGISELGTFSYGVLWKISSEDRPVSDVIQTLLSTNIVHNPYAHDCYQYA